MIVTKFESVDNLIETAGIFVVSDRHAAFGRIRIVKEAGAAKVNGVVVVLLYQVEHFRVYWYHAMPSSLGFHSADNVAFVQVHVL